MRPAIANGPGLAAGFRRATRAFTLAEIMISATIMALLMGGIMAMIMQSRRLTEGSIVQNCVVTIVQGYMEQMKNMEYALVAPSGASASPVVTIPTMLDETTADTLTVSWGSPPSSMPALGTTPTGAVDNAKSVAIRTPAVTPSDTLSINIWVWVKDLTGTATNVTNAKSITMIYTYQVRDGGRTKSYRGSIRSVRSVVPSF